jgi:sulfotransferase family protein
MDPPVMSQVSKFYRAGRRLAARTLKPLLRSRRANLCCCGLSKTGTHSMAGLFEGYRSAHHPDAETRLPLAIGLLRGEISESQAQRILRGRDRDFWLEMESSSLGGLLIRPLARACPDKKFVLTVREPLSWCDSWLDHNLSRPTDPASPWGELDRLRLRVTEYAPTRFDAPLGQLGFPPLACFFQLWAAHNQRVLDAVPPERLLVVETSQIGKRVDEIARFAGVAPESLRSDRSWLFTAPKKHGLLGTLDPAYVRDSAQELCGALMTRFRL